MFIIIIIPLYIKSFKLFLLACLLSLHVSGLHRTCRSAKQKTQQREHTWER